jgi:hypothetical protein
MLCCRGWGEREKKEKLVGVRGFEPHRSGQFSKKISYLDAFDAMQIHSACTQNLREV